MAKYRVYAADHDTVDDVLANIRPADRDELIASRGPDYARTLHEALDVTEHPLCVYTPSGVLCVFGLARPTLLSPEGIPWLIGTRELPRHYSALAYEARRYIAHWQSTSTHLYNYVGTQNRASVLWLRRLGFTIGPAEPHGVNGEMFHRFELECA